MAQLLGQVATGTVVKLKEDGIPAEYLVFNHGNPSIPNTNYNADGTWVIKIENATSMEWGTDRSDPNYKNSDLDDYLEGDFYNKFDDATKKIILSAGIYSCAGYNGLFYRRVFCISSGESSYLLAPLKDINPMNTSYFSTRGVTLVVPSSSYEITTTNKNGSFLSSSVTSKIDIKPVMVLNNNTVVLDDGTVSVAPEFNSLPIQVMEGQSLPITWSAMDGATAYTLQRKVDGGEWTQVYSGADTTYTDTVPAGTTLQYQVQATIDGTPGAFGQSGIISVISASALAISGQDGNLGTITNDITYAVSSDTGNPITLTRTVNGVQVASLTVESGFAYNIPVMDLPTGKGTIVITASVNTSGGSPVTATRTWTYTKTAFSFTNTGSTAQLQQEGKNMFPATLAECVRVGANLGGDLGHALEMLAPLTVNGARIETGSYTGTGTYGEDNPTTLVFSGTPILVFVYTAPFYPTLTTNGTTSVNFIAGFQWARGVTKARSDEGINLGTLNFTEKENSLSWYQNTSAVGQANNLGTNYYYIAFLL